jgi:CHAT domain-containing protein
VSFILWSKRLQVLLIICSVLIATAGLCGVFAAPGRQRISRDRPHNAAEFLVEANRLSWLGNWYGAGSFYAEAESLFRKQGDKRNELYAHVGRLRANQASRWDRTSDELRSMLDDPIARKDKRLRLWCLAAKGYTDINLDSASAKSAWIEALEIAKDLHDEEWAARASGELGTISFLEGDTARAVSLIGRAIFSAYRTGDTDDQVRLLSMLGNGFNEEHRFAEALTIFKRAVATAEAEADAGYPFIAYAGLANALIGAGDYERAQGIIEKTLLKARTEDRQIAIAEMFMVSGDLALARNDIAAAEAAYEQAGIVTRRLRFVRGIADSMFALSGVEKRLGHSKRATEELQAGIKASRRLGDRYYLPRDLTALAELKTAAKRFREAEALFTEAEDVLDEIVVHQHSFEESTAHAGSMSATYLGHFKLERQLGNVDRAFQVIERVRGRIVASKLLVRERAGSRSPIVTKIENDIAATQLALLRIEDPKSRSALMEQLLAQERNLAFELNEAGLRRTDILAKPALLERIQRTLRHDEVFAEYVLDEPTSFCIVATRSSKRLIALPAGTSAIGALVRSYLFELNAKRSGSLFAAELYRVLLAPVVSSFRESRIVISPDDALYALPFEALRDGSGFVLRSKVISYTPSGNVLWRLRSGTFQESKRPMLAVGAVDYKFARELPQDFVHTSVGATVVRGLAEFSGAHLEDLPGSRDEVVAVTQIAGHDSQLLEGQDATESRFKSEPLSDFRVIHLATHATADPQYPDRAGLILGVTPKTSDDGMLQVREIMGLSLNADLVTLSACETSVGADRQEAGVISLEQAFLIAGARAVLASLWNVEDNSTTALMKAFYQHLVEGEDKALALTHAKRDMLDRYGEPSPYYWAGFLMVGEAAEKVRFGK